MSKIDDKSGYDHILLFRHLRQYFGIEWQGWWLVGVTLPFGWRISVYVYQTVGLGPTNFFRSLGVACSLYIDDHLNGELFSSEGFGRAHYHRELLHTLINLWRWLST